jgi:ERCC4-type nuclease
MNTLKIKCDDREDGIIIENLRNLNIECEICRLKTGDYIFENVCIERKTMDDFCMSIMDGRIKSQSEKMLKNYKYNYILISGRISDRKIEINENCIIGMISSLVVKGINVICVDTDRQLAYLIKRIFERYNKNEMPKL